MLGYAISELESLRTLPGRDDFIGKFFNARHAAELTHKWHERTLAVSAGERRRHFRGLPCEQDSRRINCTVQVFFLAAIRNTYVSTGR